MFDLLIPIDLPPEAGFTGKSPRAPIGLNNEVGFTFGPWPASFHHSDQTCYLIIRTGVQEEDARKLFPKICTMIAKAGAELDISMRPAASDIVLIGSSAHADLEFVSLFPSGETPLVTNRRKSFSISLPAEFLTNATAETTLDARLTVALRLFGDVDFESSVPAKYVLLTTILEVLAEPKSRDDVAQGLFDQWEALARAANRSDLVQALNLMRRESIGASIGRLVEGAAIRAGLTQEEMQAFVKLAKETYRRRGAMLHGGATVTVEELTKLRQIVRLVLVGKSKGTPFTPIGNRQWHDKLHVGRRA